MSWCEILYAGSYKCNIGTGLAASERIGMYPQPVVVFKFVISMFISPLPLGLQG